MYQILKFLSNNNYEIKSFRNKIHVLVTACASKLVLVKRSSLGITKCGIQGRHGVVNNCAMSSRNSLLQLFSNYGSQPKCASPRLCRWAVKACKLPRDLRTQEFKSEDSFLRDHYDFKTKIQKSKSDSR